MSTVTVTAPTSATGSAATSASRVAVPGPARARRRPSGAHLLERPRAVVVGPLARAGSIGFSLMLMGLLLAGLLLSLVINTARAESSFRMTELQQEQTVLMERRTQAESALVGYRSPDRLAERARDMGMVPAGEAAYITPEGKVLGVAEPAAAEQSPTVGAGVGR